MLYKHYFSLFLQKVLVKYYLFPIYKRNVFRTSVFNQLNQLIWKPYFILPYTTKKCILYSFITWHFWNSKALRHYKDKVFCWPFSFFIRKQSPIYEHLILTYSQWTLEKFSCSGSKNFDVIQGKRFCFMVNQSMRTYFSISGKPVTSSQVRESIWFIVFSAKFPMLNF